MKKRLIVMALLAGSGVCVLSSCDEEKATAPTEAALDQAAVSVPKAELTFTAHDLGPWVAAQLGVDRYAQVTGVDMGEADAQGVFHGVVTITLNEDLFRKEFPPATFDEERKLINAAVNRLGRTESEYLLQVGAPPELITEEDRKAKPLPQDVQGMVNELTELAQAPVYALQWAADVEKEVPVCYQSKHSGEKWEFSDFRFDGVDMTQELDFTSYVKKSELPEGAAVLTPEFKESRKAEIRAKGDALIAATTALIQAREAAARGSLAERTAKAQEAARVEEEKVAQAAAEAQAWKDRCVAAFASGSLFTGEWVRDERFGELSLEVREARVFDTSVQFFGVLFDTKLPAAMMQVEGRCEFARDEKGVSTVVVTIYDGMYVPDQPTAEVFDSKDGQLVLSFDAQGKLAGTLGCVAWKETPERMFQVKLAPQAKEDKSRRKE